MRLYQSSRLNAALRSLRHGGKSAKITSRMPRRGPQCPRRRRPPMLSRRDVLATTVAAGAGLVLAAPTREPAKAQPVGRMIVDSQVHIWLANTPERRPSPHPATVLVLQSTPSHLVPPGNRNARQMDTSALVRFRPVTPGYGPLGRKLGRPASTRKGSPA
jgi:hypothetical protein